MDIRDVIPPHSIKRTKSHNFVLTRKTKCGGFLYEDKLVVGIKKTPNLRGH